MAMVTAAVMLVVVSQMLNKKHMPINNPNFKSRKKMKNRIIALSLILAGTCVSINAQEAENYYTKKWTDNIFVGAGIGGMAVFNDGMNTTFNLNISAGKYITPTWGIRAQLGGFQQKIGAQKTGYKGDSKTAFEWKVTLHINLLCRLRPTLMRSILLPIKKHSSLPTATHCGRGTAVSIVTEMVSISKVPTSSTERSQLNTNVLAIISKWKSPVQNS